MLSLQKHIIICTQQFDNYWSGVGTYGTNLARGLVRTGWKVTVISPGEYSNGNDEINLFIWRAMNTYYLWQPDVPDLSDTRFTNIGQLYSAYSNFSSPRDVFESLRYQPSVIDRFSWIVDDYITLENSFQGINLSNGMETQMKP